MRQLEGSCHCGAVCFSVVSRTPQPYMRCYCSICRKTGGGGGYAINLMADAASLKVTGKKYKRIYHARGAGGDPAAVSPAERHFCGRCGSALYLYDPRWPDLLHPFASAIDSPLPRPPAEVHLMLAYKPDWVDAPAVDEETSFAEYPALSIEDWHRQQGLFEA